MNIAKQNKEPINETIIPETPDKNMNSLEPTFRQKWSEALTIVFPLFLATRLAFFVTTCLSSLFTVKDFSWGNVPDHYLWLAWQRWDTNHYMSIAVKGYDFPYHTAFFPFYPMLERSLLFVTGDPFFAGLLVSNIANLLLLMVLYQLVKEDFSAEQARSSVLYLSLFPTAFFLAAAYNESLFLCLSLMSFYNMRHGGWWLAGLCGFLAALTRSAGLLLLVPFCYEYLRQRQFKLPAIRFDVVSGALIPAAVALFGLYCYLRFNDFLAFSHAQQNWQHQIELPWHGMLVSVQAIIHSSGFLSFQVLRNLLDLLPDLGFLLVIILTMVGPWRFPRSYLSYSLYAAVLYLFLQLFPVAGTGLFPLTSLSRYLLEIFPAFILLAGFAKSRLFHFHYVLISGAILFFLLTQFLTGHWVL